MALPAFVLVLARVAGLMLAAPFFSSPVIPTQISVLLAAAMSLAIFPLTAATLAGPVTMGSAVGGLVGELAIGLVLGLGVTLVLVGIQVAAQLVSQQAGAALGEVFNPMLESSSSEVAQLYFLVAMSVFMLTNGHHAMVRALLDSFTAIPLLGFKPDIGLLDLLISMITLSFTIAIRVSGPAMLALLLAFLTLGFISRTVPQLNLLTVGFPIKLAMALLVMALTLIGLEGILVDGVVDVMDEIRTALGMVPR